jgi:hypothetical protein
MLLKFLNAIFNRPSIGINQDAEFEFLGRRAFGTHAVNDSGGLARLASGRRGIEF